MIKNIKFINFRSLNGRSYSFSKNVNLILGKNGSGKTSILEGIKIAFSTFDGSYIRVDKSDFTDSDDSKPIEIKILLEYNSIPSFNLKIEGRDDICGFKVVIRRTQRGQYRKEFYNYDGSPISPDIVYADTKIPQVHAIPMTRIGDIHSSSASISLDEFIESDDKYRNLKSEFKASIKESLKSEIEYFKTLSMKYGQDLDIEVNGIKTSGEKLYAVKGDKEHNFRIGAGYKGVANIIFCTMSGDYNIILIDEIENHLHPALLRTLIQELANESKTFVIATTHSPVAVNQMKIKELIDSERGNIANLVSTKASNSEDAKSILSQLNMFLHPGRNELMLADNVVVVEGFSEELILRNYIAKRNINATIVNAQGVMFKPYLTLANMLGKRVIAVSDNDRSQSDDGLISTSRFRNLKKFCNENDIKLLEVDNTFETDIFNSGYCKEVEDLTKLLKNHSKHTEIMVAKSNSKTDFAMTLIKKNIDLSNWHVIKGIEDEFGGN